ncbi:hypothetical protein L910_1976 [Vibrio fluvialis PG41]|uniref:Uncharacterized protein n=1 Tax=Vibrio fluvialis PG41 TaxID=1336752 RepID=S7HXU6_VIBFL|nr:type 4b pilus protein PilO2 [Vibrio fluvialis]EPP20482.1 hypothetical protein L910_1976 [Vibrio fluvialis PG41]
MVNKAKINGVEFGFGLVWEDLNSQKTKAQIQSILDVNSCKFGVHKKDKDNPDEQQLGYTNLKELKGTLSAAYVLASISKEITVIEKISEEDFWICGVNEGKIISTTDVVVAQHDLADHIENLKGTYSDIEIPFEITCSEEVAEIISEMGVEVSVEEYESFESKLQEFDLSKSFSKQARITSLKGVPVLGIVLGFVLVGAGAVAYSLTSPQTVIAEAEWTAPVIKEAKISIKSQEDIVREIKAAAYAEEVKWLTEDFRQQDPVEVINSFIDIQRRVPMFIGGWEVQSISYERQKGNLITVELQRGPLGTPVTLRESLLNYHSVHIVDGGNKATISFDMHDIKRSERITDIVSYIRDHKYKDVEIIHDSHFMGYKWSVVKYDFSLRREPIAGIANPEEAKVALLKNEGKLINIVGNRPYKLAELNNVLERSRTTLIETLTMSRKDDSEWQVQLLTYTK